MPPDNIPPGSPQDWLRYALADLKMARYPLPKDELYQILCFHAQQAAEKSVKAVLIKQGIEWPRTHRLKVLIDLLPDGIHKTPELAEADRLTPYAVTLRYPSIRDECTEKDYLEAMRIAEKIYSWAKIIMETNPQ